MTTGNGGPSPAEQAERTYERLVEKNREATSTGLTERIMAGLGEMIVYVLAVLFCACLVLGMLAVAAGLWKVVAWGFGL